MKLNIRIFALPFMAALEVFIMLLCLSLTYVNTRLAISLSNWYSKLPDFDWYLNKNVDFKE